eukprot:gene16201-19226_t
MTDNSDRVWGRGADGELMCSYHGWQFNGCGKCTRIPQIINKAAEGTSCRSSRSSVATFPVSVACGMIWVFPDNTSPPGEKPFIPKAIHEYLEERPSARFFMRDLPYGHDILLENLLDPSHLPFSHHGVGGLNRANMTQGHGMQLVTDVDEIEALTSNDPTCIARTMYPMGTPGNMDGVLEFKGPHFVGYKYHLGVAGIQRLLFTVIIKSIFKLFPYKAHMFDHAIFDGDGVFLTRQQNTLYREGRSWKSAYYCPSLADSMVIAMRKWYDEHGMDGQPLWHGPAGVPRRPVAQEEVLDRYNQHTKHCAVCKGGLRRLKGIQLGATIAAVTCWFAFICACISNTAPAGIKAAAFLLTALSLA